MSSYQRKESLISDELLKAPLIAHARCLQSSPDRMEGLLGNFVSEPQVTTLSEDRQSHAGFFASLASGETGAAYLAFGEPVTLRLWNRDCFCCVLPFRGRARLEQYPRAVQGLNGPFFLLPKSDQQWQLSADCELFVVWVHVEAEVGARIRELLDRPRDYDGCAECARVMMESFPYRLHHGLSYVEKLDQLQRIRREFLQLFGFHPEQQDPGEGLQVADPRVRRAMDYLVRLPASEYQLDDICEVAHMSPRGLYYAFKRNLGCTPYSYFRACHLIRVRLSLLADAEQRYAIAWHASTHGFRHMSRFAAHYRSLFGELPSETRQRLERDFTCPS